MNVGVLCTGWPLGRPAGGVVSRLTGCRYIILMIVLDHKRNSNILF